MKCCTVNIQLTCELLYNKHITNLRIAVGGGAPEISSLKQTKKRMTYRHHLYSIVIKNVLFRLSNKQAVLAEG